MKNKILCQLILSALVLSGSTVFSDWSLYGQLQPLPTVVTPSTCDQNGCNPTSGQDPYIYSGECSIGIERFLSRAIEMGFLAQFNYDNDFGNTYCDPPYNASWSFSYCPDKYCELIEMLPQLDAQLIKNAYPAGAYHEHQLYPGEDWYTLGYQIIKDINYAYDCAGKSRPIIQGFIGEVADPNNFQYNITYNHPIPTVMIEKYFDYYPEDLDIPDPDAGGTIRQYYFEPTGAARTDRFFTASRIAGSNGHASIDKVEMRMWFLYQAITLIDFGYTGIHMGIYWGYANHDADPGYEKLYKLTNVFRQYATERGSFVVLSGETPMGNVDDGQSAKLAGTDQLIFDFDSRAMRPREISTPSTNGDGISANGELCDDPISQSTINAYMASPCGNDPFPAVIDPCTINNFGGSGGGIAPALDGVGPSNCTYEQVPYVVHFDGFSGMVTDGTAGTPSTTTPWNYSTLTWGFDDHRWFSMLSSECKQWWFDYFYCDRRNFSGGHGYVTIPGIINITFTETFNLPDPTPSAKQLLSDDPQLLNSIINTLAPQTPQIIIQERCTYPNDCQLYCRGQYAGAGKLWKTAPVYYVITVGNQDCSSVYSIHVKDPQGNWLPQEIGDTYYLYPEIEGNYQIGIRRDNLALPLSTFGTDEVHTTSYLYTECCFDKYRIFQCFESLELSYNCLDETPEKFTYSFEIISTDPETYVDNLRTINNACELQEVLYQTNGRAEGIIHVFNKEAPRFDIMMDYHSTNVENIWMREPLDPCIGFSPRASSGNIHPEVVPDGSLSIAPNPATHQVKISYQSSQEDDLHLLVFDAFGQLVDERHFDLNRGPNSIMFSVESLSAATYFIITEVGGMRSHSKIIKQ